MSMYTYEQFEREARAAGLYDRMNQADIALARKNPDAGMSILSGLKDYQTATTPEQRALIHEQVESVRRDFGGYSGGADGSGYNVLLTPNSFTPNATPDREYSAVAGGVYDQLTNYGDYQGSKWQGDIDSIGQNVAGYGDYKFDPDASELSQALKKQYAREIGRATEDTMANAAALSGGLPSSYAATAAAQAGDYYASQYVDRLADVASLENAIYQANFNKELSKLAAMQSLDDTEYQRYLDGYNRLLSQFDAGLSLDSFNEGVHQSNVQQNNVENNMAYGQLLDQIEHGASMDAAALNEALSAAQYGDYSKLNALGINTSRYEDNEALNRALALAEVGDYSGLKGLGIDTSALESAAQGTAGTADLPSWSNALNAYESTGDTTMLEMLYGQLGQELPGAYESEDDVELTEEMVVQQLRKDYNLGASKSALLADIDFAEQQGIISKERADILRRQYGK